ncbi:hypothetical protein D3C77_763440 [compost metagenome]
MLVGRVQVLIWQAETHQHDWGSQHTGESLHDWDGASILGKEGTHTVYLLKSIGRRLQKRV